MNTVVFRSSPSLLKQQGLSLIELMIAITLGLFIVLALSIIFLAMSEAKREQFKAAEQIENGRFSVDLLTSEIRHAGFFGEFGHRLPPAGTIPDPCDLPVEGPITATTTNHPFAFHIQGYEAASASTRPAVTTNCAPWLNDASLRPGSDIIVTRRADTVPLIYPPGNPALTIAPTVLNGFYLQATSDTADIQYGNGGDVDSTLNARGATSTLMRKDFTQAATGTPPVRPEIAAYIRRLHVSVYFVSNCSRGSGANGTCTSADDTIPTLKRLELTAGTFSLVPLVEGVEYMKFRYGLDTVSAFPGRPFDGVVDSYVSAPASAADWQHVVQVEVNVLARNLNFTTGYSDGKTYNLGGMSVTPTGDDARFKRHAFTTHAYVQNIGGRREF